MCGIVGIVYKDINRRCDESVLMSMRDTQIHRGPDGEGIFIDGNVGLGHRRLSIIDLGGGRQPMSNEDGSVWITYNGEIYNYRHLREDLIRRGHIFKTKCDTEVILHLYEEKGEKCVDDLNGMFAFAIWDKNNQTIFLARDRMGIKPLYYVQTEQFFMFSSEMKSFFENKQFLAECNDEAVFEYLLFRDVSGERTLFKGVNKLLPGHTLTLKDENLKIVQYWSTFPKNGLTKVSFNEAVEELTYLIKDAVKIRLMSDVPLGTFCSGGIDSSLVTAVASQSVGSPINTFSVGFNEKEYDETSYARMVSKRYGTNHHELKLNNREFADYLPKMIWHNDEPLNYSNSIHMYAISKLAKEYVTVVLTGEGADELLAGYPRIQIPGLIARYQKIPAILRIMLQKTSSLLKDHRLEKLQMNSKYSVYDSLLYNSSILDKDFVLSVYAGNNDKMKFPFREGVLNKVMDNKSDLISKLCLLDQSMYLVSILNRQDKMSMAASIESRIPLLDYRIVEFANRLPVEFKVKRFKGKQILKKIADKFLPNEVIDRRKSGFGIPLKSWFKSSEGLGDMVHSVVDDPSLNGIFDRKLLGTILDEHKKDIVDHSEFLWTAINLSIWKQGLKV